MTLDASPIHDLRDNLAAARLAAVEELSAQGGAPTAEALQKLAALQSALVAVDETIKDHEVKIGGGGEKPLK